MSFSSITWSTVVLSVKKYSDEAQTGGVIEKNRKRFEAAGDLCSTLLLV